MNHERPALDSPDRAATRITDAWCKLDHDHAFVPTDHDAIEATRPLRLLVVESLLCEPGSIGRDLLHAFGALGRIIAEQGGSPTLAVSSVDGLLAAMGSLNVVLGEGDRVRSYAFAIGGRAAMAESYVLAVKAAGREEALRGWEYPACVVPVDDGLVAIAAGCPDDDNDALTSWASRVARGVTVSGARRAVLSGSRRAILALEDALELAGVECVERRAPTAPVAPGPRRS